MAGVSLRTVRNAVLLVAALLILVVAGFLGYARYRLRQFGRGLPDRFGMHITQESDNVTYSQTLDKRTIFTVHAAKQVEHGDGKYTLHNVGIILYGREGDRSDRVRGDEFEYDQKKGILRAVGECFIDLAAPPEAGKTTNPAGKPPAHTADRMIHVKTSGLVFLQKERSASTDRLVEFTGGGATGSSVGAAYDSAAGVLILRSAVAVSGVRGLRDGVAGGGRPMLLHAASLELDRVGNVARLETPTLVTTSPSGDQNHEQNATQTVAAEHAIVHMTSDGMPQRVDAQGRVTLTGDGHGGSRAVVTADRMELDLNESGQPKYSRLLGGVQLVDDAPGRHQPGPREPGPHEQGRHTQGHAAEAQIAFDPAGRPVHAVMLGGVEMMERAPGANRHLNAAKVEFALSGGGKERVLLRSAVASGGAALHTIEQKSDRTSTSNDLRADLLTARFADNVPAKGQPAATHLTDLEGQGKSFLEQLALAADGTVLAKETSTGDKLTAAFRVGPDGKELLTRAEQRGSVNVVRETPGRKLSGPAAATATAKPDALEVQHARAEMATFDHEADRLTLTGSVQLSDAQSALFADRVENSHSSGDSSAEGAVRVSYLQPGSTGEPVHVTAARAISHKASGLTQFFAAPGTRVKMWQGGSQVEAPVLDLNRTTKTLIARDEQGAEGAVHALLVEASPTAKPGNAPAAPIRVVSRTMTYLNERREVQFHGHVRVEEGDGVLRADQTVVYLMPAPAPSGMAAAISAKGPSAEPISLGGRLDHLVASGSVELEQPGRKATGERLLYTAADRTSVLTGTRTALPRLVDRIQGTVTGASLRFRSGDDSVVVSGSEAGPASGAGTATPAASEAVRVRSETKMKQQH